MEDEAPFEVFTLDPRYSFVVYHSGLGEKPLMGVKYIERADQRVVFSVYTKDTYYELESSSKGRYCEFNEDSKS